MRNLFLLVPLTLVLTGCPEENASHVPVVPAAASPVPSQTLVPIAPKSDPTPTVTLTPRALVAPPATNP